LAEGRHRAESRRIPPALIVVPIVLVAVGAAAWFFFLRDGDGLPFVGDDTKERVFEIPDFEFRVARTLLVPSTGDQTEKFAQVTPEAQAAIDEVAGTMSDLYAGAFLDPNNWRKGRYHSVFDLFHGTSKAAAKEDLEILTAGSGARKAFRGIEPGSGSLDAKVLTDPKGNPVSVAVRVSFVARAKGRGPERAKLISRGSFILAPYAGAWRIVSYEVERDDVTSAREVGATAAPTTEATP